MNLLRIPTDLCKFSAQKEVERNSPLKCGLLIAYSVPLRLSYWEDLSSQGHIALQTSSMFAVPVPILTQA